MGDLLSDSTFQSATIKETDAPSAFRTFENKYYKIMVNGDGSDLLLSTENYGDANVVKENGLYNIIVRDYIFNDLPSEFSSVSTTGGTGTSFSESRIETSSSAVIHQIDNVLTFE